MSWLSFHGRLFFSLIYPHFANFSSKMGKVKVEGLDFPIKSKMEQFYFSRKIEKIKNL
jgi:hypothetical protein